MQIVDTALAKRAAAGRPLQVGVFGAGFMTKGILNQVARYLPGMRIAAICNRTVSTAVKVYEEYGQTTASNIVEVSSAAALDAAIAQGKFAVTDDPDVLCHAAGIEVLIEATGHVEYGARVTLAAIAGGKDMVSMNAELDATVGPLLKVMADKAGVILSGCDGDQPGITMNLVRFVQMLGMTPRLCGNIKGLQDRTRNPTTQEGFARQWGQTPSMVTSFADGSKISFEQAITANATGMKVAQRGMIGMDFKGHVDELVSAYDLDMLRSHGGIVDYVVGAKPGPGVYVFAEANDKAQAHYLNYGKLGEGPLYSFYVPWHLTALEVPISAARVGLLKDTIIAPIGRPMVDVITMTKIDLKAGQTLDGIGHYMTYGQCENYEVSRLERLLPLGLAEGCTLKRDIGRDQPISWDDVAPPTGSLVHALRTEQDKMFP
jgi:predicted homoserine dehydrogenase-like protein